MLWHMKQCQIIAIHTKNNDSRLDRTASRLTFTHWLNIEYRISTCVCFLTRKRAVRKNNCHLLKDFHQVFYHSCTNWLFSAFLRPSSTFLQSLGFSQLLFKYGIYDTRISGHYAAIILDLAGGLSSRFARLIAIASLVW